MRFQIDPELLAAASSVGPIISRIAPMWPAMPYATMALRSIYRPCRACMSIPRAHRTRRRGHPRGAAIRSRDAGIWSGYHRRGHARTV